MKRLREAMIEARMTPEDVAAKVDVAPSTVYQWLSGKVTPNLRNAYKLAEAFEKDPGYFLEEGTNETDRAVSA